MSSTDFASIPGVSKELLRRVIKFVDQRFFVVFRPTVPVIEADTRTDPPVSVPNAMSADPCHRLTPAPLLDPPGTLCWLASHGFLGVPQ